MRYCYPQACVWPLSYARVTKHGAVPRNSTSHTVHWVPPHIAQGASYATAHACYSNLRTLAHARTTLARTAITSCLFQTILCSVTPSLRHPQGGFSPAQPCQPPAHSSTHPHTIHYSGRCPCRHPPPQIPRGRSPEERRHTIQDQPQPPEPHAARLSMVM